MTVLFFQVKVPTWLNLKETGSRFAWGGTLPPVKGIENAILIKIFDKEEFASLQDFKKYIVEDLSVGQTPPWSKSHIFMGKKDLNDFTRIGSSYKVYVMYGGLIYHCVYVLLETPKAYLWINFHFYSRNI